MSRHPRHRDTAGNMSSTTCGKNVGSLVAPTRAIFRVIIFNPTNPATLSVSVAQKKPTSIPGPKPDQQAAKEAFLAAYIEGGTITAAATVADISRDTHYDWMKADADYKAAFWHAREASTDELEEVAITRAKDGSDGLLKFLLEGRRREVYGKRTELTGADGGPIEITRIKRMIVDPANDEDE